MLVPVAFKSVVLKIGQYFVALTSFYVDKPFLDCSSRGLAVVLKGSFRLDLSNSNPTFLTR